MKTVELPTLRLQRAQCLAEIPSAQFRRINDEYFTFLNEIGGPEAVAFCVSSDFKQLWQMNWPCKSMATCGCFSMSELISQFRRRTGYSQAWCAAVVYSDFAQKLSLRSAGQCEAAAVHRAFSIAFGLTTENNLP